MIAFISTKVVISQKVREEETDRVKVEVIISYS
jgi:hypothetical protein